MAGAGYKLFTTGQVLTAAEVNTYLQEQVIMVFNDATARTTALSGVLAEGMVSYLKSTKVVEIYNGTAWASLDDPNAIQNTIVDAKGDLITATANDTPARLAVGNSGETIVADSSTSTGLRWQGDFAAGKNKIINGDFRINQRNFSTATDAGTYTFDRWYVENGTANLTTTAQTFTPGTAPVAGYEGINFIRGATTTASNANEYALIQQRIEDVRTFAGQTVTVSFWAKAASGTPKLGLELAQNFGSGGSSQVNGGGQSVTLSTSWTRYSLTYSVASISGKTVGTNSHLNLIFWLTAGSGFNSRSGSVGTQSATIDIWGVQAENGNVATAFQTATGTLAGELAACQRYYWRTSATNNAYATLVGGMGMAYATGTVMLHVQHPVPMRTTPSSTIDSGGTPAAYNGVDVVTGITFTYNTGTPLASGIILNKAASFTQYRPYGLVAWNDTSTYFGLSAEL